jgi:lysozyme
MKSNGPADLKLVDLSHNNNVTSWSDLKGVVDGVYIKATQGVTITDPKFIEYATAAISRHIPTGFYHYFTPADEANARQQADHFYAAVKGFTYNLIPVLDVEETDNQSASAVCADVKAFEKEFLKLSGHKLMIYCSPTFADNNLSDPSLAQYPLWIAHYNVNTPRSTIAWQTYDMWQYGSAIKVAGILKPVDADFATSGIFLDPSKAPTPKGVLATSSK